MNFNVIDIGCRSICIELDNDFSYETRSPVRVSLNGKILGDFIKNFFTLKDLSPDTEYEIEIAASCDNSDREVKTVKTVTTKKESVLLEVKDFGAAGDGVTNDTAYLQAAISACPINGTVHIGKGIYLTGPLFLKSDINHIKIHLKFLLLSGLEFLYIAVKVELFPWHHSQQQVHQNSIQGIHLFYPYHPSLQRGKFRQVAEALPHFLRDICLLFQRKCSLQSVHIASAGI